VSLTTPSNSTTSPAVKLAPLMAVTPFAGVTGPVVALTAVLLKLKTLVVAAGAVTGRTAPTKTVSQQKIKFNLLVPNIGVLMRQPWQRENLLPNRPVNCWSIMRAWDAGVK
jgi:hypothetical protein